MSEAQVKVRKLATEQFLVSINYPDRKGNVGARGKAVHRIELKFDNGEVVSLTPQELLWSKSLTFHLKREE